MLRRAIASRYLIFNRSFRNANTTSSIVINPLQSVKNAEGKKISNVGSKKSAKKSKKYDFVEKGKRNKENSNLTLKEALEYRVRQLKKIANDPFGSQRSQLIADLAVKFISNHTLAAARSGYIPRDEVLKLLNSLSSESSVWSLISRMYTYNSDIAMRLHMYTVSGESSTALFERIEALRQESFIPYNSVFLGKIIYSVPMVYNTLLRSLADEGNYKRICEVLQWIREDGFEPDIDSFLYLLQCMGHKNSEVELFEINEVIQAMAEQKINIEDMMWLSEVPSKALDPIMRAIRRVYPNFKPKRPNEFMKDDDVLQRFPVLERCLSSDVSSKNHFHGVQTDEELMENFKRQYKLEVTGGKSVEPIAVYKSHHNPALREKLLNLYKEEEKTWRERLIVAVEKLKADEAEKEFHVSLLPFLEVLPATLIVDAMLQELLKVISTSNFGLSAFTYYFQISRRIFSEILRIQRKKKNVYVKYKTAYEKYIRAYNAEERNTELFLQSHIWHDIRGNVINGLQLGPMMPSKSPNISVKLGQALFDVMCNNVHFNPVMKNRSVITRQEIPVLSIGLFNDGVEVREILDIHPKMRQWVELAGLAELWFPSEELPMLCPPIPWVRPERQRTCGFLLNAGRTELVRKTKSGGGVHGDYENRINRKQLHPVLDAINSINGVAWKVNTAVLDVAIKVFRADGDVSIRKQLGLPLALKDLPDLSDVRLEDDQAKRVKLRELNQIVSKLRNENYSLWADTLYRLSIANNYRNEIFWFPLSMDFRGRVYPCSGVFSYMGNDLSRSILLFAKGKPLGPHGLDWLLTHIINLTGLKKRCPLDERLEYGKSVVNDILDSAAEPLTGRGWWRQSDDPWQTLAACKEIEAAMKSPNPEEFISHLPVHQDGSCNGLQHYAALGRDEQGADCVNLCNRDAPKDVYSDVVDNVEQQRKEDAANGVLIAQVLEGYVQRKVIKQSVMTTVYGVTMYGAKGQISRQLRAFDDFPLEHLNEAATYLAKHTLNSIKLFFTASTSLQSWLINCASGIVMCRKSPVTWETPLGMYVLQPYFSSSGSEGDLRLPVLGKQRRAFPPNFIHSLDSTHMMLTALHSHRAGITFSAVHDCFWTHAVDVNEMNKICRQEFVALHQQPLIPKLSQYFSDTYGFSETEMGRFVGEEAIHPRLDFNKVAKRYPGSGNFDLHEVLHSTYFFG